MAYRAVFEEVWRNESLPMAAHAGLVLDRFLKAQKSDNNSNQYATDRRILFQAAISACNMGKDIYTQAFKRFNSALDELCVSSRYVTKNRIIVGFGGENVLESGITLHKTYGTPVLPGSALKGLASHYCDQVWGAEDPGFQVGGCHHNILFGTIEDAGHIRFFDGWITPDSLTNSLCPDVLTPHHQDYYMGDEAPTDFDDPNPVTFLSVFGTFLIGVSCDVPGEKGENWANLALTLLSAALSDWGIGGKTSSGYGRMERIIVKEVKLPEADTISTGLPEFKPGDIVPVLVLPHPKKPDKIVFKTSDGYYGYMADNLAPPVTGIGERTELKVKEYRDAYWFTLP